MISMIACDMNSFFQLHQADLGFHLNNLGKLIVLVVGMSYLHDEPVIW